MSYNADDATIESAKLYRQLASALDSIKVGRAHYCIYALIALGTLFNAIEQYNVGYASPLLIAQWGLTSTQIGLLSTATFGAMAVGSIATGAAGDIYGRKRVFIVMLAIYSLGSILAALAPDYQFLFLARILIGLGLGGEISLGFTVVSELMPTRWRGAATASLSFVAGGVGIFAASALAALMLGPMAPVLGGDDTAWRWFFGVMVVPALLIVYIRRYMPETPRYLVRTGQVARANKVLSQLAANRLRVNSNFPVTEYIRGSEGQKLAGEKVRFGEIFSRHLWRHTLVAWLLILTLFSSVVTFTIFMPAVLVGRGIDLQTSLVFTTIINAGGLVGGLVGIAAAHYIPRRAVFVSGAVALSACAFGFFQVSGELPSLVFGVLVQFLGQVVAATAWTYLPELYPTRVRAFGTGTAATMGLAASAAGPLVGGIMLDTFGGVGMLWLMITLWAIMGVAALLGPETSRTPLEDVTDDAATIDDDGRHREPELEAGA